MRENSTRAGQVVQVHEIGPCTLWAQAPGHGAWWAIDETNPRVQHRIRWSSDKRAWVIAQDSMREPDPRPVEDPENMEPLFEVER